MNQNITSLTPRKMFTRTSILVFVAAMLLSTAALSLLSPTKVAHASGPAVCGGWQGTFATWWDSDSGTYSSNLTVTLGQVSSDGWQQSASGYYDNGTVSGFIHQAGAQSEEFTGYWHSTNGTWGQFDLYLDTGPLCNFSGNWSYENVDPFSYGWHWTGVKRGISVPID